MVVLNQIIVAEINLRLDDLLLKNAYDSKEAILRNILTYLDFSDDNKLIEDSPLLNRL